MRARPRRITGSVLQLDDSVDIHNITKSVASVLDEGQTGPVPHFEKLPHLRTHWLPFRENLKLVIYNHAVHCFNKTTRGLPNTIAALSRVLNRMWCTCLTWS